MTFGEYWPTYQEKKRGFVKDTSLAAYTLNWEIHIKPFFQHVDMDDVKNSTIQCYVDSKVSEGLSTHSIQDHVVVIKNMIKLRSLELDKPLVSFVIIWPTKASRQQSEREKYTNKELEALIEYCKNSDSHFEKIVALAALTGLRIGELCGLRFSDFDFENGSISVRRTVGRMSFGGSSEIYVNPPKCGASERRVPVPNWLMQYFKRFQKLYNIDPEQYISKSLTRDSMPFLEPRTFRVQFKRLCTKVGIPYRTFHSLRHTYASRLLQAKVDIRTTAELLGHSDVQTTLNTYAHSDDAAKRAAAKKIFL